MIAFWNFELDYKLHFFPALRAVVNAGFDQSNGERTNASRFAAQVQVMTSFGTNEFSKKRKKSCWMLI
jgi:iron complex outermembrane receptor protein